MLEQAYSGFTVDNGADGVCVITLNRPDRLNGFNWAVKRDLTEAMTQLSYDDTARIVVITGGENFSAGDDFGRQSTDIWGEAKSQPVTRERHDSLSTYNSLRTISQGLNRAVRSLDKITIAAIDGYAIQSGLSLALACDFRLVTPRAKLGSGTLRMGYLPDEGGHFLLVQMLGVARTKDFLLRKKIVSGVQAFDMGLANELVEPDELMARTLAFASELAEGPQVAMRLLKHAIDNAADMTFEQACMDIAVRTAISDHHPDAKEGPAAFREKPRRKPVFNQA
jgi:2-(1,2-epoxy-1,2-dihydrophenyl)acetyl-CoA isomerase